MAARTPGVTEPGAGGAQSVALAESSLGNPGSLAVLRDRPPSDVDPALLQASGQLRVTERSPRIFIGDHFTDHAADVVAALDPSVRSLDSTGEEPAELHRAERSLDVLAVRGPTHRRDVNADLIGDRLHRQRAEMPGAATEEVLLVVDDRLSDIAEGPVPLIDRVEEPPGGLDLAADVLENLRVLAVFAKERGARRRDPHLRHRTLFDLDRVSAVDLLDEDLRTHLLRGRLDERATRIGLESAQERDRFLHIVEARAQGLGDPRESILEKVLEALADDSMLEFVPFPQLKEEALTEIARSDPGAVHVVIWDGAGFHHHDGDPELPGNVRLLRLPAYSPELNPVEKLWDIAKDGICNRLFETLDDLEDRLAERLRPFWEDAGRVASLVGSGWLLGEVNAI